MEDKKILLVDSSLLSAKKTEISKSSVLRPANSLSQPMTTLSRGKGGRRCGQRKMTLHIQESARDQRFLSKDLQGLQSFDTKRAGSCQGTRHGSISEKRRHESSVNTFANPKER